jgi:hypothetical protein
VAQRRIRTDVDTPAGVRKAARTSVGATPVTILNRGRLRLELIRDLAMGEWSHASIAKRLGVDTADITDFAEKYVQDISEVRSALAGQLAIEAAGLWISKKQNRIAELQADFDELNDVLVSMRAGTYRPTDNDGTNLGSRRHRGILKSKMDLLRAVADELSPRGAGATAGSPDDPNIVHYIIEAGDVTEALR